MKRKLYNSLIEWKNGATRKPLILEGARQVGKTWLLLDFGRNEYEHVVYINCADDSFAKNLFLHDLKPNRIIRDIEAHTGQTVVAGQTLIIFDEIQEAPHAITALKYVSLVRHSSKVLKPSTTSAFTPWLLGTISETSLAP